jgi:hypothetical protein
MRGALPENSSIRDLPSQPKAEPRAHQIWPETSSAIPAEAAKALE